MKDEILIAAAIFVVIAIYMTSGPIITESDEVIGEPCTCGNGELDYGESYMNCNKDTKASIITHLGCVTAGEDECLYHSSPLKLVVFMLIVAISTIAILGRARDD